MQEHLLEKILLNQFAPPHSIDFNGYNYPNLVDINSTDAFNDTLAMYNMTFSDQVVGIYKDLKLDPQQTEAIEFVVNFDPQYATACVEKIACFRHGFAREIALFFFLARMSVE